MGNRAGRAAGSIRRVGQDALGLVRAAQAGRQTHPRRSVIERELCPERPDEPVGRAGGACVRTSRLLGVLGRVATPNNDDNVKKRQRRRSQCDVVVVIATTTS